MLMGVIRFRNFAGLVMALGVFSGANLYAAQSPQKPSHLLSPEAPIQTRKVYVCEQLLKKGQPGVDFAYHPYEGSEERGADVIYGDTEEVKKFPNLKVDWHPYLRTAVFSPRFYSSTGDQVPFDPKMAKIIAPIFHGNGGSFSHSGSVLDLVDTLSSPLGRKKKGFIGAFLKQPEIESVLPIYAMAADLPDHGAGPPQKEFEKMDQLLDWFSVLFNELKSHGGLLIPIARSGTAGFLMEFMHRRPGVLDGLVVVSLMHPSDLEFATKGLRDLARAKKNFYINEAGLEWATKMYAEMGWHKEGEWKNPDPFQDTPVLYIGGTEDTETSVETREIYLEWSDRFSHFNSTIIEGAPHNPFDPTKPKFYGPAFEALAEYYKKVLLSSQQRERAS